jgi:hypothetical protein
MDNIIFMSELSDAASNIQNTANTFSNSVNNITTNSDILTNLVTNLPNKIYRNKKVIYPDWNSVIYKCPNSSTDLIFNFDGAIYIRGLSYKEDKYDYITVSNNQSTHFSQREYINGTEELISNIAIPIYKGIKYNISCGDNFTIHGRLVELQENLIERIE